MAAFAPRSKRAVSSLTVDELAHFHDHGYVVARGLLRDEDLAPMIADLSALVAAQARAWSDAGLLADQLETLLALPFETQFGAVVASLHAHAAGNVEWQAMVQQEVARFGLSLDTMYARTEGTFDFFFRPRLLDAIASLVGEEILLSPIQHLRPYLPAVQNGADAAGGPPTPTQINAGAGTTAPWHQDMGVTREEADGTDIITCWIPLVDATTEMGAMRVIPDLHAPAAGKGRGLLEHVKEPAGTAIRPDLIAADIERQVSVPCEKGDLLLMHHLTPHKTGGQNVDPRGHVRWSLDIRFQRTGTPTGRPFWPEVIVRSAAEPGSEQRDYAEWCRRWEHDLVASAGERWHRVAGDVGGSMGGQSLAATGGR